MRHNKKFNHLGRTASHRNAMLANMATSLILSEHKRITTTLAKAKALKKYVEPLITRSKNDTTTSRRVVFRYLQNKYAVKALFGELQRRLLIVLVVTHVLSSWVLVRVTLLKSHSSSLLTLMRTWLRLLRQQLRRLVVAARLRLRMLLLQRMQLQRL